MNPDSALSLVRQLATMAAAYLVGKGVISGADSVTLVSALVGVASVGWSVYSHWGMMKVPEGSKVIVPATALGFALLLCLGSPSSATDLTIKAPAFKTVPACTISSCTGLFVGGFVANAGGNLDVIGTGLTGLAQNGIGFGGQAGYEFWNNQFYAAFYVDLQDDMSLNTPPGTTLASKLTYGVNARLGYSLASAFGAATTGTTTPALPQQFLASLMTPYINAGEVKRHGEAALRSGAGVEALLATNVTLNADYFHYTFNQGGSAGNLAGMPVKLVSDNEFRLSINRHFGF